MIKYSTNPGKDARAITDSPTAPISTTGVSEAVRTDEDITAEDANDN